MAFDFLTSLVGAARSAQKFIEDVAERVEKGAPQKDSHEATPAENSHCFNPPDAKEDDKKSADGDGGRNAAVFYDMGVKFRELVASKKVAPGNLIEFVQYGYRAFDIDVWRDKIRDSERQIRALKSEYSETNVMMSMTAEVTGDALYSPLGYVICQLAGGDLNCNPMERIEKEVAATQTEKKYSEGKHDSAMTSLLKNVFAFLGVKFSEEQACNSKITSMTYGIMASTFSGLGEVEVATRMYQCAQETAPDMATKVLFRIGELTVAGEEELQTHKEELNTIYSEQIPALLAMSRAINRAQQNYDRAVADTAGYLDAIQSAQGPEDIMKAEDTFKKKNPEAYRVFVQNLIGTVPPGLQSPEEEERLTVEFTDDVWKKAGYKNSDYTILPGSVETLSVARLEAWNALYDVSKNSNKQRVRLEKEFDKILFSRGKETKDAIPDAEALLYATSFGNMLIKATVRGGTLEQLLMDGGNPDVYYNKLVERFDNIRDVLKPHVKKVPGNQFYETEGSLAMRLRFDAKMAYHRYTDAFDEGLPYVIENYGGARIVGRRLEALTKIYSNHFSGNCVVTGQDFSETEAGLDAASRMEAMFMQGGDGMGDLLMTMGGALAGGAMGCIAFGALGSLGGEKGVAIGCAAGQLIGGVAGGVGTELYNQYKEVREHEQEIREALRAGVSTVSQEEAEMYKDNATSALLSSGFWGAIQGAIGARIAIRGLGGLLLRDIPTITVEAITESYPAFVAEGLGAEGAKRGILGVMKGIPRAFIKLPTGTQAMIVGGSMMAVDYFAINDISVEKNSAGDSRVVVDWETDYHIDTAVGVAGAIITGLGAGKRLAESPEFRGRFLRFLFGKPPESSVDPKLVKNFWHRLAVDYDLMVQDQNFLVFGKLPVLRGLSFPFNVGVGKAEQYLAVPALLADFGIQQFLIDEQALEESGIQKTPKLSIFGGLGLALTGNRVGISYLGLIPGPMRLFFTFDRLSDVYTQYTSGNQNMLDADWYRIGAKYVSGWIFGQIRGSALTNYLSTLYNNRYVKSMQLRASGLSTVKWRMDRMIEGERDLYSKLISNVHCWSSKVYIDEGGYLLKGGRRVARLTEAEKKIMINNFGNGRSNVHEFVDLFGGKRTLELTLDPTLNFRGAAVFAALHDGALGPPTDYARAEYIAFGDGKGYATWTAVRLPYLMPRTALKSVLNFKSARGIFADASMRYLLDNSLTSFNGVRLYKSLWVNNLGGAFDGTSQEALDFFTGTSAIAANGVDAWNVNRVFDPNGESPTVDTCAKDYTKLTSLLQERKVKEDQSTKLDRHVDAIIKEARYILENGGMQDRVAQTVIEHAEVLGAVAYSVHMNNPDMFEETIANHGEWLENLFPNGVPILPSDVGSYATGFGESTIFGEDPGLVFPLNSVYLINDSGDGRSSGFRTDSETDPDGIYYINNALE